MGKLEDYRVSWYQTLKETSAQIKTLAEVDSIIRTQLLVKQNVEIYRKTHNKAYKELLPCVTLSAIFNGGHKLENWQCSSGLIQIDIDTLPEGAEDSAETWSELRRRVYADKFVFYGFESPSGKIKAVIQYAIPTECRGERAKCERIHREVFNALSDYFKNTYNVQLDPSTKDLTRLCFLSHDDNPHHNPNAKVWVWVPKSEPEPQPRPAPQPRQTDQNTDTETALRIVEECERCALDIVPNYQAWVDVGRALADSLGAEGLGLFLRLSAVNGAKYNRTQAEQKYNELQRTSNKVHTLATLVDAFTRCGGDKSVIYKRLQPQQTQRKSAQPITEEVGGLWERDCKYFQSAPPPLSSGMVLHYEGRVFPISLPTNGITMVCAPSGHGKTTFALNVLLNLARADKSKRFYYLSTEEEPHDLRVKFCNIVLNRVEYDCRNFYAFAVDEMKNNGTYAEQMRRVYAEYFESGRVVVANICRKTSTEIVQAIEESGAEGVGGVFVDYAQKVQAEGFQNHTQRAEALQTISEDFNTFCGKWAVPVVFLSQFNRTATSPISLTLSALAQSSAMEWNAHYIIFLWSCQKSIRIDRQRDTAQLMYLCKDNIDEQENVLVWKDKKKMFVQIAKNRCGESEVSGFLNYEPTSGKITTNYGDEMLKEKLQ